MASHFSVYLLATIAITSVAASALPSDRSDPSPFQSGEIVGVDQQDRSDGAPPHDQAPWDHLIVHEGNRGEQDSDKEGAAPQSQPDASEEEAGEYDLSLSDLTRRSPIDLSTIDSVPLPFDTSILKNFTVSSCPKFFKKFLNDKSINECHGISLLLHDSTSFFHTLSSAPATSRILDQSCGVDVKKCSTTMRKMADDLIKDDHCGKDYRNGNPNVVNAYTDLIIYEPVYRASCLKNPDTKDYCFVDAVKNRSNAANYDIYSLPYGVSLLKGPYPDCNECVQASLDVFGRWAEVDGQPLARSYLQSAKNMNKKCGAKFSNTNITTGSAKMTSGAWETIGRPDVTLASCFMALCLGVAFLGML